MLITKFGHACLLVERGAAKILIDPGSFSSGFEELTGLTAVLYTHKHADHYDDPKLRQLLAKNSGMKIVADEMTAEELRKMGHEAQAVHHGDELQLGGEKVAIRGSDHAIIHRFMPQITNVGYMISGRFFYPGDALTVPAEPVEILALPVEAPWTRISEVVDYLLEVRPKVALPAHESVSAVPEMQYGMIREVAEQHGIRWQTPAHGDVLEV